MTLRVITRRVTRSTFSTRKLNSIGMKAIIKILILSDFFIFCGAGLINPIFAVYIKDVLRNGSLAAAGMAATIFLLTKAIVQIPVARFVDKEVGNVREFWTLFFGNLMIAIVPFSYLLMRDVSDLYVVQMWYGFGAAIAYPGFMAIFTKFADHEKAAFSWSFYSTSVLLVTACAATLGGIFGERYGFRALFIAMGVLQFLGFFTTIGLALFYNELKDSKLKIVESFGQRLVKIMRKSKHQPTPPLSSPGTGAPK